MKIKITAPVCVLVVRVDDIDVIPTREGERDASVEYPTRYLTAAGMLPTMTMDDITAVLVFEQWNDAILAEALLAHARGRPFRLEGKPENLPSIGQVRVTYVNQPVEVEVDVV